MSNSYIFQYSYLTYLGPSGTEMRLPVALVSQCSSILDKLINGDMREAQNGVVEIVDVEEDTFVCFG